MLDWLIEIGFQELLKRISLEFIIFNLMIGFSIFVLYFYGTRHWEKSSWNKRVICCLLIGFFSVAILTIAMFPIVRLLVAFHAENLIGGIFYPLPLVFLLYLLDIRSKIKMPLYSERGRDYFHNLLFSRCYKRNI